ncbi:MAG: winged helix-turn-helix domain-containing protein [Butyricicoccus sp.]
MQPKISVYLCDSNGERFFGEGPYRLLLGVREHGSLRAAAQQMGMAYTKAMRLMKHAEEELGFPLTSRTIGGRQGGGSVLTPEAEKLLVCFEDYRKACIKVSEELFHRYFDEFASENN